MGNLGPDATDNVVVGVVEGDEAAAGVMVKRAGRRESERVRGGLSISTTAAMKFPTELLMMISDPS